MIRLAKDTDIDTIMDIYKSAKKFMNENGNPDQWRNNYPTKNMLLNDIQNNELYVYEENDEILAVFCFFIGIEPTYNKIYEGKWLNDKKYGVIHRIAVNAHGKGIASKCIEWCFQKCHNLKIDTHKNNTTMQKTILKNGFFYCGIIKKEDGTTRLAYQRFV